MGIEFAVSRSLDTRNGYTPHDLRRTCATRLGDMGVPDEIIGRVLNHSPTSITGKVYNKACRAVEVRQALDAWAEQLTSMVGGAAMTHPLHGEHNKRMKSRAGRWR